MNLRSRYGYLILALKQYPFEKEIKERIEEIEVPWKPTDPNTGIKSNKLMTPKVLADIIKKESSRITSRSNQHYQNSDTRETMGCN